jgi:hypothetical protein
MAYMPDPLPVLAADLTYVKVNGGVAYSGLVNWDDEVGPTVGQHVLAADGSNEVEAVITEIRPDGDIRLSVPAWVPPLL